MNFRKETLRFSIFLLFCKCHFVYILNHSHLLTIYNNVLEFIQHPIKVVSFFPFLCFPSSFYLFIVSSLHIIVLPIVFIFFSLFLPFLRYIFPNFLLQFYFFLCLVFIFRFFHLSLSLFFLSSKHNHNFTL